MSDSEYIDVENDSDADTFLSSFRESCIECPTASKRGIVEKHAAATPLKRKRRKKKIQLGRYKNTSRRKARKATVNISSGPDDNVVEHTFHVVASPPAVPNFMPAHVNRHDSSTDAYSDVNVTIFQDASTQTFQPVSHKKCQSDFQHAHVPRNCNTYPDTYFANCVRILSDEGFIASLLHRFEQYDLLPHFMSFLKSIENGSLPPDNIAVLLAMERSILLAVDSSTQMRYTAKTKQFWEFIYRVGGGHLIRLMSGSKHFNKVNLQEVPKSRYTPVTGDFNFIVPDEKILANSVLNLPKEIMPGFMEQCMPLIDNSYEYFLSVDGKKCAQGLRDYGYGDENLLGLEEPSLDSRENDLQEDLSFMEEMSKISLSDKPHLLHQARNLAKLVHILSRRIRNVREAVARHEKQRLSLMKSMTKKNENPARYRYGFSAIDAFITRASDNIDKLLSCNRRICAIMANLNETTQFYTDEQQVDLTRQANCHLLMTPEEIDSEALLEEFPDFIKQRSAEWHDMRKKSRVTASTLYNAVGLRQLRDQRRHFKEYVLHKTPKPHKAEVVAAMDFGTRHEVHSIASLVTLFASAFLPPCYHYFEVGSKTKHGQQVQDLLMVSPDGIFKCGHENDTSHVCKSIFKLPFHQELIVEIKSIYSAIKNKTLTPVLYNPRECHVPQTCAQMEIWETNAGIYVTAGLDTFTVTFLEHSNTLWQDLWSICKEFYDEMSLDMPDYVSELKAPCKDAIQDYLAEKATFFCEMPLVRSKYPTDVMEAMETPIEPRYYPYKGRFSPESETQPRNWETAIQEWLQVLTDAKVAVQEAFQLERRKATELIMFVLSNADRITSKKFPLGVPVCYCLKGRSLSQEKMRTLITTVLKRVQANNTRVLATVMDGQWSQVVFRSRNNTPLTELELQRDIWQQFNKAKLPKLLLFINEATLVRNTDLNIISRYTCLDLGHVTSGNVGVFVELCPAENGQLHRTLTATCLGGKKRFESFIRNMLLPSMYERPDLYTLQTTRMNLFDIIINQSALTGLHVLTSDDCVCSLDTSNRSLYRAEHILLHTNIGKAVMQRILVGLLAYKRFTTWQSLDIEDLFYIHMRNGQQIYKSFHVPELDIIVKELLNDAPENSLYKTLNNKADKTNFLATLLGVHLRIPNRNRPKSMLSLRHLAFMTLRSYIPLQLLRVAAARVTMTKELQKWRHEGPIPNETAIPVEPYTFKYFSYPDYDEQRSTLQPMSIDPTHILTNLRLHCTSKSVFFCDHEAFLRVCDSHPRILSRPALTEMLDKQNCALAQSVFSLQVQTAMRANGDLREATQVKHIRQFFDATNKRGISVLHRIKYLVAMEKYCRRFWNSLKFPAPTMYVCGMPLVTFQAIMQTISSRLQLYRISLNNTYNHRAKSTLTLESIFSDVTTLARHTNGCPLACDLPRLAAKLVQINATKHDPQKCFSVRLSRKTNYPCMLGNSKEQFLTIHYRLDTWFRPHDFDFPDLKERAKKKRRLMILQPDEPERGTLPVRAHHRIDESRINATLKL